MSVRLSQCAGCRRPSQALATYGGVGYCAACLANRADALRARAEEAERERDRLKALLEDLEDHEVDFSSFDEVLPEYRTVHPGGETEECNLIERIVATVERMEKAEAKLKERDERIAALEKRVPSWRPDEQRCDINGEEYCSVAELESACAMVEARDAEVAALRLLVEGKDGLLAAYRIGRPPSEKTWKKLEKAKAQLDALADTPQEGSDAE